MKALVKITFQTPEVATTDGIKTTQAKSVTYLQIMIIVLTKAIHSRKDISDLLWLTFEALIAGIPNMKSFKIRGENFRMFCYDHIRKSRKQ